MRPRGFAREECLRRKIWSEAKKCPEEGMPEKKK